MSTLICVKSQTNNHSSKNTFSVQMLWSLTYKIMQPFTSISSLHRVNSSWKRHTCKTLHDFNINSLVPFNQTSLALKYLYCFPLILFNIINREDYQLPYLTYFQNEGKFIQCITLLKAFLTKTHGYGSFRPKLIMFAIQTTYFIQESKPLTLSR